MAEIVTTDEPGDQHSWAGHSFLHEGHLFRIEEIEQADGETENCLTATMHIEHHHPASEDGSEEAFTETEIIKHVYHPEVIYSLLQRRDLI